MRSSISFVAALAGLASAMPFVTVQEDVGLPMSVLRMMGEIQGEMSLRFDLLSWANRWDF
jgi:hypothetical protein